MTEFINPSDQKKYYLKQFTTCSSPFIIYAIQCPCPKIYVGKTIRPLKIRIGEHLSNIRNNKVGAPLTQHCTEKQHSHTDLKFWALEKLNISNEKLLLKKEVGWMLRLDTLKPKGLNEDLELLPLL